MKEHNELTSSNSLEGINSVISSQGFSNLEGDLKKEVLQRVLPDNKGGNIMSKMFGDNKELLPMYYGIFLSILLLLVGLVVWIISRDMQIWNWIIPAITSAVGYIFGKSNSNSK